MRSWDDILGVDWGDIGKDVFSGVHLAGRTVLSLFGAGAIAQPLERIEEKGGLLKDWAKSGGAAQPTSTAPAPGTVIEAPDYVVLVYANGQAETISASAAVRVVGGRRFEGNGYKSGEKIGKKFSFGYDAPDSVEVALRTKTGSDKHTDVKQAIFLGGKEQTRVAGLDDEVLGELGSVIVGEWTAADTAATVFLGPWGIYRGTQELSRGQPRMKAGKFGSTPGEVSWQAGAADTEKAKKKLVEAKKRLAAAQKRLREVQTARPSTSSMSASPVTDTATSVTTDSVSVEPTKDESGDTMSDYLTGCDVLGEDDVLGAGAKPPTKPPNVTLKKGSIGKKKAPDSARKKRHPLQKARGKVAVAAKHALTSGKAALALTKKYNPKKHVSVVGLLPIVVGATSTGFGVKSTKPLTPKQTAAVNKHNTALVRTKKAVDAAAKAGKKALTAGAKANKLAKALKVKVKQAKSPAPTRMHGVVVGQDDIELMGALELELDDSNVETEIFGEGDMSVDDTLLTLACEDVLGGEEDEIGDFEIMADESAHEHDIVGAAEEDVDLSDVTQDDLSTEPPAPVGGLDMVWDHVPGDAVKFDGDKYGTPSNGFGSYNFFCGQGDGFLWTGGSESPGSPFPVKTWAMRRETQGKASGCDSGAADGRWSPAGDPNGGLPPEVRSNPTTKRLAAFSVDWGWGPLIGNPQSKVAGLQYARLDDVWFWQAANAPSYATEEIRAAKDLSDRQAAEANAAAADAEQKRKDAEQAAADEEQAKRDAEAALHEQAEQVKQTDFESEQARQQAAFDFEQQKQEATLAQQQAQQQAQFDAQQAQQDAALAQQQAQLDLQAQQAQLEWEKAHPETAYAQPQAPAYYGGSGGGGGEYDGGADDGPPGIDWNQQEPNYDGGEVESSDRSGDVSADDLYEDAGQPYTSDDLE